MVGSGGNLPDNGFDGVFASDQQAHYGDRKISQIICVLAFIPCFPHNTFQLGLRILEEAGRAI